jgi:DNA-binding LytR/AlgR family response regulator
MNILVIEDEKISSDRIKKIVENISSENRVIAQIYSVAEGLEWFEENQEPDLIFSDIQLGDGTSFEIFEDNQVEAPIIFMTAYNQYAIDAFKLNSIDYLLKPIRKADLINSIEKFKKLIKRNVNKPHFKKLLNEIMGEEKNKTEEAHQKFLIKKGTTMIPIFAEEIALFFADKSTTYILTKDGKKYILDHSLDTLEQMLGNNYFRISRQFIVPDYSIVKIHQYIGNRLLIDLKIKTPFDVIVSRRKVKEFKNWYE